MGDGSGMETFMVHQNLICPRSVFFQNALKGPWKELEERRILLPDDEPAVFSLYLRLLYVSHLLTRKRALGTRS